MVGGGWTHLLQDGPAAADVDEAYDMNSDVKENEVAEVVAMNTVVGGDGFGHDEACI